MASETSQSRQLIIKKYPNRRFYDTTRSAHVTLGEMHDLIRKGYELTITDSKTGEDITNLVLTQIILERDPPKLDIFPANILHQVIRTQHQFLGSVVEQYFRQAVEAQKVSQERWVNFLHNTLGLSPAMAASPLEWTRTFMEAFTPRRRPATGDAETEKVPVDDKDARDRELEELRRQVVELSRRIEEMSRYNGDPAD